MKRYTGITVLGLTAWLMSCAPTAPDTAGFDRPMQMADDVVTANLMPWIEKLAEARANDKPVDCTGFEEEELFPACRLTRDASVKLVAEAFQSMGFTPDTVALGDGPLTAYNISAEWRGTTKPQEVILVGSHLDAFYAGADDNGSAVAAMLEIARAVRKHRFARTIRFVAFDLEEYGSIGSTRYVRAGYANDVVAALVMDLIGYASSKPGSQKDVLAIKLPDTGDFLLAIGNQNSATMAQEVVAMSSQYGTGKILGVIAPGDGAYFLSSVFMRSDHGLLWYRGIPALFFTDTANFRNPHYHKPTDTPASLDAEFLGQNTKIIAAAVARYAEVLP
jgi:Zn-dependent M28 family amino/carboxypeptidase